MSKNTLRLLALGLAIALTVWIVRGRDRGQHGKGPTTLPAGPVDAPKLLPTPAEPVSPETQPAEAQLIGRSIYFHYPRRATSPGQPVEQIAFPPAVLRLTTDGDDPVEAMLYSDDPTEAALGRNWQGDRYYFQFPLLGTKTLADVDGAVWGKISSGSAAAREETDHGFFRHGNRVQMEPVDVRITLTGQPPNVQVHIWGKFLQYDSRSPAAPPEPVVIEAQLMPRVETK